MLTVFHYLASNQNAIAKLQSKHKSGNINLPQLKGKNNQNKGTKRKLNEAQFETTEQNVDEKRRRKTQKPQSQQQSRPQTAASKTAHITNQSQTQTRPKRRKPKIATRNNDDTIGQLRTGTHTRTRIRTRSQLRKERQVLNEAYYITEKTKLESEYAEVPCLLPNVTKDEAIARLLRTSIPWDGDADAPLSPVQLFMYDQSDYDFDGMEWEGYQDWWISAAKKEKPDDPVMYIILLLYVLYCLFVHCIVDLYSVLLVCALYCCFVLLVCIPYCCFVYDILHCVFVYRFVYILYMCLYVLFLYLFVSIFRCIHHNIIWNVLVCFGMSRLKRMMVRSTFRQTPPEIIVV